MSEVRCENCDRAIDDLRAACPFCRMPRGGASLARAAGGDDDAWGGGLAKVMTGGLLARDAAIDALLLDRELDVQGPLAPSELGAALARVDEAALPTLNALEDLLVKDAAEVALDGITLVALVDRGKDDLKILKRGLTFLKHGRHGDALEWWVLQREGLDATRGRFELLLLLMEAFTCSLAGDGERAASTRRRIREHPLYVQLRQKGK